MLNVRKSVVSTLILPVEADTRLKSEEHIRLESEEHIRLESERRRIKNGHIRLESEGRNGELVGKYN